MTALVSLAELSVCLWLLWLGLRAALPPKYDTLGGHDVTARVIAGTSAVLASGLLLAWKAMAVAEAGVRGDGPYPCAIIGPVLFFPLAWCVGAYLAVRVSARRLRRVCTGAASGVQEWVNRLALSTGLGQAPEVLIASLGGRSPRVVGWSARSATLVLPRSFWEETESVCGQDSLAAGGLSDFVVLHELAHLKDGDLAFLPWARSLLRCWPGWVLLPAGAAGACALIGATSLPVREAVFVTLLLTVAYAVLRLSFASSCRMREFLADARGPLALSGGALARITGEGEPSTTGDAPLAKALLRFGGADIVDAELQVRGRVGSGRWLRYSSSRLSGRWIGRLFGGVYAHLFPVHPSVHERLTSLRSERYTAEVRDVVDTEGCLLLGAASGAVLQVLSLVMEGPRIGRELLYDTDFGHLPRGAVVPVAFWLMMLTALVFAEPRRNSGAYVYTPTHVWLVRSAGCFAIGCLSALAVVCCRLVCGAGYEGTEKWLVLSLVTWVGAYGMDFALGLGVSQARFHDPHRKWLRRRVRLMAWAVAGPVLLARPMVPALGRSVLGRAPSAALVAGTAVLVVSGVCWILFRAADAGDGQVFPLLGLFGVVLRGRRPWRLAT